MTNKTYTVRLNQYDSEHNCITTIVRNFTDLELALDFYRTNLKDLKHITELGYDKGYVTATIGKTHLHGEDILLDNRDR